ncbi:tyrosine-type recombinase/integrase [Microvirga solisilvae]|uniref:tyrosine-type recombinase/integrase n=1 Tax=Microvirga solisilvae TaxID=2919498 RepID=UPI001FAEEB6C|nr:tyrosine-type recombinase/integrase [Microvirga solisilvae]
MAKSKKGPKNTQSGWEYVYNLPNRHGRTRWYFWFGKKGDRQYRVKGDIIHGQEFQAAYARFLAGQHPYPGDEANEKAKPHATGVAQKGLTQERSLTRFAEGSWGKLCIDYMATDKFKTLKNRRAIEGQLRWTWSQPVKASDPDGRRYGDMPVERFDTEAIQTLVDRKIKVIESEMVDRSGEQKLIPKTIGGSQKNNLIKWIKAVLKLGIKRKLVKINYAHFVEKEQIRSGGYKMWTDEMWNRMTARYPLGTKERLTFDLAGYTAQRRGDVYLLGWDQLKSPEKGLPHGSFEVTQEKGRSWNPSVAHIPVVGELHESIEAARAAGILGSRFLIKQDRKDIPYTKESFGNRVRRWLDDAGIPKGYSLHGLRKLCVCRLIERGCNPHEVMAVTGHQTLKEIDRYAKAYFRQKKKVEVYDKWSKAAAKTAATLGMADAA